MPASGVSAKVVAEVAGVVAVELRWREPDRAKLIELFQVVRLSEGRVVDIQDFERRAAALRAVGAAT